MLAESKDDPAGEIETMSSGDNDKFFDCQDTFGYMEDQVGLDKGRVEEATGGTNFSFSIRIPNNKLYLEEYFRDHYSLLVPSSAVRFRSGHAAGTRVIENESNQIILEERYDPGTKSRTIEVKRVRSSTKGVLVLRALYTIVCALWVGIFLVVAIQVMLSLVLDLSVLSGQTSYSDKFSIFKVVGMSLGLIQLCFTFSEGMVIATRFLIDTWSGHHLVKEFFFMRKNLVFVDWMFFVFFLGIPLVTAIVSLFARSDDWWIITGITWFGSISVFFAMFAGYTVFFEVRGAMAFVINHHFNGQVDSFWRACWTCIHMRQIRRYSGKRRTRFLARSIVAPVEMSNINEEEVDMIEGTYEEKRNFWAWFTQWKYLSEKLHWFKVLDEPRKLYTIADSQGLRPYVTKWTWSLERIYCNPSSSRFVAIIEGPGALTRNQVFSNIACSIIGTTLIALIIISLMTWLQFSSALIGIITGLLALVVFLNVKRVTKAARLVVRLRQFKLGLRLEDVAESNDFSQSLFLEAEEGLQGLENGNSGRTGQVPESATLTSGHNVEDPIKKKKKISASENIKGSNTGIYVVAKDIRITEANPYFCGIAMVLEIFLFYLWPGGVMYSLGNVLIPTVYIVIVGISGIRHYFNIEAVIEETGTMNLVPGKSRKERWMNQSRLSDIVENISTDKSKWVWFGILTLWLVILLLIYLGGVYSSGSESSSTTEVTFLPNYYYPEEGDSIRYPTCSILTSMWQGLADRTLADFAFLSALAYRTSGVVDKQLTEYFGTEPVTDEREYVSAWRNSTNNTGIAVSFNLFRFETDVGPIGIVSVRGTATAADLLADNQLWLAAMLTQLVRAALPFGGAFTPFLGYLVSMVNALQSNVAQKVTFYKVVTPFLEHLKEDSDYIFIAVTGHSLGGGIAIISGAQAQVPAVAISGPNAMLSGRSFEPPVLSDALDRYTFNVRPDRDIVPRFDDVAQSFQNIRCVSDNYGDVATCHNAFRTMCELSYNCGTGPRPAFCECHTVFGYPKPLLTDVDGINNFDELCVNATSLAGTS